MRSSLRFETASFSASCFIPTSHPLLQPHSQPLTLSSSLIPNISPSPPASFPTSHPLLQPHSQPLTPSCLIPNLTHPPASFPTSHSLLQPHSQPLTPSSSLIPNISHPPPASFPSSHNLLQPHSHPPTTSSLIPILPQPPTSLVMKARGMKG